MTGMQTERQPDDLYMRVHECTSRIYALNAAKRQPFFGLFFRDHPS
jgi:hypothetical protein